MHGESRDITGQYTLRQVAPAPPEEIAAHQQMDALINTEAQCFDETLVALHAVKAQHTVKEQKRGNGLNWTPLLSVRSATVEHQMAIAHAIDENGSLAESALHAASATVRTPLAYSGLFERASKLITASVISGTTVALATTQPLTRVPVAGPAISNVRRFAANQLNRW